MSGGPFQEARSNFCPGTKPAGFCQNGVTEGPRRDLNVQILDLADGLHLVEVRGAEGLDLGEQPAHQVIRFFGG